MFILNHEMDGVRRFAKLLISLLVVLCCVVDCVYRLMPLKHHKDWLFLVFFYSKLVLLQCVFIERKTSLSLSGTKQAMRQKQVI